MAEPIMRVLRAGDTSKPNSFTIWIIANPALEAPWNSGQFIPDPIVGNQAGFDASAAYIEQVLFGLLPSERESIFSDPLIGPRVRVASLFATGLSPVNSSSLVGQDSVSDLLIARRTQFVPFLAQFGYAADVAYAVTASPTHTRASAWFTSDDDTRPGVSFMLDGASLAHRFFNVIPGTIAIHATAQSITPLHEFQHAISSYTNGSIVDLYVDSNPALNCKAGRPIPPVFATYDGMSLATDPARDGLGYPANWSSYHCGLFNPALPAIMDNYWLAPTAPEQCENDLITRQFINDRLRAKVGR